MLNRYYACILFLFSVVQSIAQDRFPVDEIPQKLTERANAVVRDQQWTVNIRSSDDVILHVKQVLTILNRAGLEHARLAILYDKSTQIKSISGILQDHSGEVIKKISVKDFIDESAVSHFSLFEDNRVKHFLPNAMQYPFTVSYEYELKLKQNLVIPDWVPKPSRDLSIEQSSYTLRCGLSDGINIKEINFEGQKLEEKNDKQRIYTWTVRGIPASKNEPLSPPKEKYQIRVKVAAEQFYYYGKKGAYSNWEELGGWVFTNLLAERQKPTPQMVGKVHALTMNIHDDIDKVRVLYRYLQEKMRYVSVQIGIGGFQPMAASQVEQLGYGDCKALVNYMQSLLSIVNIPSYYCVVNAGDIKHDMDENFASIDQGNHVILAVPLKKDTIWLECTSQKTPFGFLGSFTDDRIVFACTEKGGKLMRTPKVSTEESLQKRHGQFRLSEEGDIDGLLSTSFYGNQFDNQLAMLGLPLQEQDKRLKELYAVDNITFKDINYKEDNRLSPQLIEQLSIVIQKYAPKSGTRIYLIPNVFNRKSSIPITHERKMPFFINRGYRDVDSLVFALPESYVIDLKPADVQLDTEFGSFSMKLYLKGNNLVFYRQLILREGLFAPEKYATFAQFINTIYQTDLSKVVFLRRL